MTGKADYKGLREAKRALLLNNPQTTREGKALRLLYSVKKKADFRFIQQVSERSGLTREEVRGLLLRETKLLRLEALYGQA